MTPRAADRWLLAPSVAMALTLAALLPHSLVERALFAGGGIAALWVFQTALLSARRERRRQDRAVAEATFDRTRRHLGHRLRNYAVVVLDGLTDDPERRAESEAALRTAVALPDELTLDALPEPLTSEAQP